MPQVILKWKNRPEKCAEFALDSQKWSAEFASQSLRIFNYFVQNSDNRSQYIHNLQYSAWLNNEKESHN